MPGDALQINIQRVGLESSTTATACSYLVFAYPKGGKNGAPSGGTYVAFALPE